eukprot:364314-Chlamydomonas_euryale.AAC.19
MVKSCLNSQKQHEQFRPARQRRAHSTGAHANIDVVSGDCHAELGAVFPAALEACVKNRAWTGTCATKFWVVNGTFLMQPLLSFNHDTDQRNTSLQ